MAELFALHADECVQYALWNWREEFPREGADCMYECVRLLVPYAYASAADVRIAVCDRLNAILLQSDASHQERARQALYDATNGQLIYMNPEQRGDHNTLQAACAIHKARAVVIYPNNTVHMFDPHGSAPETVWVFRMEDADRWSAFVHEPCDNVTVTASYMHNNRQTSSASWVVGAARTVGDLVRIARTTFRPVVMARDDRTAVFGLIEQPLVVVSSQNEVFFEDDARTLKGLGLRGRIAVTCHPQAPEH